MSEGNRLQRSFLQALEAIDARLVSDVRIKERCFSCDVEIDVDDGLSATPWQLRVEGEYPSNSLPSVNLIDRTQAENLPHVNYTGEVCYTDHEGEGYSAFVENTPFIVANAVERSRTTLNESAAKRVCGELSSLLDEFEGYWGSLPNCAGISLDAEPGDGVQLYVRYQMPNGELKLLGIDAGSGGENGVQRRKVEILRLEAPLLPPPPMSNWEQTWFNELLSAGEQQGLQLKSSGPHILLCQQPRPCGGFSLFGISYVGVVKQCGQFSVRQLKPFCVNRGWRRYLLNRVGASPVKKRVALIGCGSLGGRVAEQLALSGVDELVLVDPERFHNDNIFRHVLGRDSVGKYKAEGLAQEIRQKRPGMTVLFYPKEALTWLRTLQEHEECSSIVLLTGNLALERNIIRMSYREKWPQQVVSGWVEPLGLGGHAIASRSGKHGCLECLHRESGAVLLAPKTQFLTAGQKFSENLTGCGGAFTPYSALATTRTALLVTELVLGDETSYRCWTGKEDLVKEKGLTTTYWYRKCFAERQDGAHTDIYDEHCPCCAT